MKLVKHKQKAETPQLSLRCFRIGGMRLGDPQCLRCADNIRCLNMKHLLADAESRGHIPRESEFKLFVALADDMMG